MFLLQTLTRPNTLYPPPHEVFTLHCNYFFVSKVEPTRLNLPHILQHILGKVQCTVIALDCATQRRNLCKCKLSFGSMVRPMFGVGLPKNEATRVGTLIVATIYLQLIQNRYMFRSFTVLQCSHQHCLQPVASDVEVAGYL